MRSGGTAPCPPSPSRAAEAALHVGVGDRGTSGQDRRSDLGFDSRRDPRAGSARAGRLRDARHHRARHHRRRDHDQLLRRFPEDRARNDQGRRLHPGEVRLRLRDLRRPVVDPRAVARHRDGRRHRRGRRSGPDVRLCVHRDRRVDAAADHARPQAVPGALVREAGRRAR